MRKIFKYCFLLFLLMFSTVSKGQIFRPDCKDKVWKYYKDGYANITKPEGKKVHYYNIIFESEPAKYVPGYQGKINLKIFVSKGQLHYVSNSISVYQDQDDAFMIVKEPRVLVRANPNSEELEENFSGLMQTFTDSVFFTSKVVNCGYTENSKKEKILVVELKTSEKALEALDAEKIVYQINETTNKLEKVTMYYVDGYKFKKSSLTHIDTDLNYKKRMDIPVRQLIFDKEGLLQSKYRSFRYIDNR